MALAEFLIEKRDSILAACARRLRRAAPELREEDLLSELGSSLDSITAALEHDRDRQHGAKPSERPVKSEAGAIQGRQRQRLGRDIESLVRDYGALSQSIMDEAIAGDLAFSVREYGLLNRTLDESVAAAVQEFWTQSLGQQQEQATERLGVLAHELRNALSSATFAFGVLRRAEVGLQPKTAAVLGRGLERMRVLVDHTLTAVKLGAVQALERRPIRVLDLLRDVRASSVTTRGVTLRIEASPDLHVEGDLTLLTSAVDNLVHNALKFTREGSTVVVRAARIDDGVHVEVEDQCGGLPSGLESVLFAPFVRGDSDRSGLGLGLSIVRDAVEAHRGRVHVRSVPGEGCVFTLELPAPQRITSGG